MALLVSCRFLFVCPTNCPLPTKSMSTSIAKIPESPSLPAHKCRSQPQHLLEEGGDCLASRFSSGRHSLQVDVDGGIFLLLKPEEEAVKTIEGKGHTPKLSPGGRTSFPGLTIFFWNFLQLLMCVIFSLSSSR